MIRFQSPSPVVPSRRPCVVVGYVSDEGAIVVEAIAAALAAEEPDACTTCEGYGEIAVPNGATNVPREDQYDIVACPDCTGEAEGDQ